MAVVIIYYYHQLPQVSNVRPKLRNMKQGQNLFLGTAGAMERSLEMSEQAESEGQTPARRQSHTDGSGTGISD